LAKVYEVIGLEGFPLVKEGDDLAEIIVEVADKEGFPLRDGDIVVVAQKIVSKAEGRLVRISDVKVEADSLRMGEDVERDPRLVNLVLNEARKVLSASKTALIVEDKRGMICINAGIDKSNVEGEETYSLLPVNSDSSSDKLRKEIRKLRGVDVAVIISDSSSRPFRRGLAELAIGLAGMNPFRDYVGKPDLFGYSLKVKNVAVADEIASSAELVMGNGDEAVPVAIIRGLNIEMAEGHTVKELFMPIDEDLFKGAL